MSRRVCVVTGTRAEFGLLRWLMEAINIDPQLTLQVVVTGMHLSPEFGSTYEEIEEAGFSIDAKVEMLVSSDTSVAITKSTGLGMIGFADAYSRLAPDMVVVLGDRFEIFAAAAAAMIAGIPIAHIHGGETTEGAFDEAIRHSISKMSHLHFVAAEEYRRRVIQLGENPARVFTVGGMGIDALEKIDLLTRDELESVLGLELSDRNLLITFHPVTLDGRESSLEQFRELLTALDDFEGITLIFTMPNADTGGRELSEMVEAFVQANPAAYLFTSLGQLRYLSCMAQMDGVVGNSSSGLTEAPYFNIGTVNIGDRQKGRLRATSIIDCEPNSESIKSAIRMLYSPEFSRDLIDGYKPYGSGGAVNAIINTLVSTSLTNIQKKEFYDLPTNIRYSDSSEI